MKVRIIEVKTDIGDGISVTPKYYKIQTSWFGFIWRDKTEPETGFVYPTFTTLEQAEEYVKNMYFAKEDVVKTYEV